MPQSTASLTIPSQLEPTKCLAHFVRASSSGHSACWDDLLTTPTCSVASTAAT